MIDGMRYLWRLADMPAFQAVIAEEIKPGGGDRGDAAIEAHVRDNSWTVFHPSCTCRLSVTHKLSECLFLRYSPR
jgi:choline dehydrogenase